MIALGFLLGLLPRWAWLALLALAVATFGACCHRAGASSERAAWQARALKQSQADAAETARRIATIEEARRAAELRTHQALADADAARAAAGRLRADLAAYARRHRAAAAPGGPAAADPIGVLADVLGRCDDRAGELARYADAARGAGELCERAYDALSR